MLKETLLRATIDTRSADIPDGLQYFFLFLLFATIILSVVAVIYFAKWLTLGPKVKKRWNKILRKDKSNDMEHGVQVKGKEVIVDASYEDELRRMIKESDSPQQQLEYQNKLEAHLKQKEKAQADIKRIEEEKLAKIAEKEELARIREEAKKEAKKIKDQQKADKEKLKGK